MTERITSDDYCRMFSCDRQALNSRFLEKIEKADTSFVTAGASDIQEYVLDVLKRIDLPALRRSTAENLAAFEKGWGENLSLLLSGEEPAACLRPKYFRESRFLRYDNKLIVSGNLNLEYDLFTLARHVIFSKFLGGFDDIYEIGCGSCQNLLLLSQLFPSANLCGFDWTETSSDIAKALSTILNRPIEGRVFDMLNPSTHALMRPGNAVITIHAIEQVGTRYRKLLSFLLRSQPGIVVHYEPILEFYDTTNLLDYLAILYSRRRNYLSGFLTALQDLERRGTIEIVEARRPYLGGVIHEASLIAWRPVCR